MAIKDERVLGRGRDGSSGEVQRLLNVGKPANFLKAYPRADGDQRLPLPPFLALSHDDNPPCTTGTTSNQNAQLVL